MWLFPLDTAASEKSGVSNRLHSVTVLTMHLWQMGAIKDKVKTITTLERDITRYTEEGKEEYKEVTYSIGHYH